MPLIPEKWVPKRGTTGQGDWLVAPGLGLRRVKTIRLGRDMARDPALDDLRKGQSVRVLISPEAALTRVLRVPRKAGSKTRQMAELELRQTLPLQGKGMIWRMSDPKPQGDMVEITAFVLKQSHIATIQQALDKRGAVLDRIALAEHPKLSPFAENRAHRMRGAGLWSMAAFFLPVALWGPGLWQDWNALNTHRTQIPALRAQQLALAERAAERRQDQEARRNSQADSNAAADLLQQGRGRSWILAELTRTLPKTAWISEFRLYGADLHLSGFTSADAVALVNLLQDMPWTARAQLDGPLHTDSYSGATRFDLHIVLANQGRIAGLIDNDLPKEVRP